MTVTPIFGEEKTYRLTQAILIYAGDAGAAATVHDVALPEGRPAVLEAGSPITLSALEQIAQSLGSNLEPMLLSDRILALTLGSLIWWTPSARRRIWFNPADKAKHAALLKLNGKIVAHPALLFHAHRRSLDVFALGESKRPTLDTPVYRAPYWNLAPEGTMCAGTVKLPATATPTLMEQFETGFYESSFSHSSWGHALTHHPKGHNGLWQEMLKAKRFPTRYLVASPVKNLKALLKVK